MRPDAGPARVGPDSEVREALWGADRRPSAGEEEQEFYEVAERLYGRAWASDQLDPRVRGLVRVALSGTATQLDAVELERAIESAVGARATRREIMCSLQLASVVGLHSCSVGIPELVEALRRRDPGAWEAPHTAEQAEAAVAFETGGPRPRPVDEMFDAILRLDHEYFREFAAFLDHPWEAEDLDPRTKELIFVAIDVACTHLYSDGIRRHIRAALDVGATPGEIFEVIQLASATGMRTLATGAPILEEVLQRAGGRPNG